MYPRTFVLLCGAAALSALIMIAVPSMVSAANLFPNPSFEDPCNEAMCGGNFQELVDNWKSFAFSPMTTNIDTTMPHSGLQSIKITAGTSTTGSAGVFGPAAGFVIPEGQLFELSVWAKMDSDVKPVVTDDADGGILIRIEWHGSPDGTTEGTELVSERVIKAIAQDLSTSYQQFSVVGAAPAGVGHIRAALVNRHTDRTVYFDDVSLRVVPEPASLVLCALSAIGLALMGRRRVG